MYVHIYYMYTWLGFIQKISPTEVSNSNKMLNQTTQNKQQMITAASNELILLPHILCYCFDFL